MESLKDCAAAVVQSGKGQAGLVQTRCGWGLNVEVLLLYSPVGGGQAAFVRRSRGGGLKFGVLPSAWGGVCRGLSARILTPPIVTIFLEYPRSTHSGRLIGKNPPTLVLSSLHVAEL